MTAVPFEQLLLPFEALGDASFDLMELPNLGAFSTDPWNTRASSTSAYASAKRLFAIVETICLAHGFRPIVGELAYLSDPVLSSGLEIDLNSFTAASRDQRSFSLPAAQPQTDRLRPKQHSPYLRAIERMLEPDGDRPPEPIGGHPSLWQDGYKGWPRVGYVSFPTAEAGKEAAGRAMSRFSTADVVEDTPLEVSYPEQSRLIVDIDYSAPVEAAFARFVEYFLEEARHDAEAVPSVFAAPFNRLLATTFLGVPFVRAAARTDNMTARKLAGLGWTPARGAMLLLFLKSTHERTTSPDPRDRAVDDLARSLHALLTETGLREAAERANNQGSLLNYLGDILHDTSHLIAAINPDKIYAVVASSLNQFKKGSWDYYLVDRSFARATAKEASLVSTYDTITVAKSLAHKNLALLEFRARGAILTPKWTKGGDAAAGQCSTTSSGSTDLRDLILDAVNILNTFLTRPSHSSSRVELEWAKSSEEVELPDSYLNPDYVLPVIYEILLNCAKHGKKNAEIVSVTVSISLKDPVNSDKQSENIGPVCRLDFVNSAELAASSRPFKYQDFLEEVQIERESVGTSFRQTVFLKPLLMHDKEGRSLGRWASLRRKIS